MINRNPVQVASHGNRGNNLSATASPSAMDDQSSTIPCQAVRGLAQSAAARRGAARRLASCAFAFAALFLTAAGAHAQAVFGSQAVGATSGNQGVTVTAQVAGTVKSVEVLTLGVSGLDFAPGTGASTCASAILAAAGTCTESVTFTPSAPGLRMGAVVLVGTTGNILGTANLSGTGSGGLGVLVSGNVLPVAGNGAWTLVDDGKIATQAELNLPAGVTVDGAGNIYIADSLHNRVRKVTASTGIISTIAGNGNPAYTGDGALAVNATLNTPDGVALDGAGNLYIADTGNNVIRQINAVTGNISTVAGTGVEGSAGDTKAATLAQLNQPWGVTIDFAGNIFIADTADHRIRRVDAVTGIITTVAGNGFMNPDGSGGYNGDNILAVNAELNRPFAVAFDAPGDMYIPDSANERIRMVNPAGTITTFAGVGVVGNSGDGGPATLANLYAPSGVAVDPAGNVYIADTQNDAIRKVNATSKNISTVIKNGTGEYYFNGQFIKQALYGPIGLYLDGSGNLFIADYYLMVVREMQSNFVAINLTANAIRQGSKSAPQDQPVENDGNLALDLTAITPATNSLLDASTTCTTGNPFLAEDTDCTVAAVFAPTVAGNPLITNIDVVGVTVNTPLDIQLIGDATAVNSTTTVVTSSLNPSGFGQTVTFTATVSTGSSSGNLTGTVSFFDGATTLQANVPLAAPGTTATATYTTPALTVGLHKITATYNNTNDPTHFSSTSAALTQTVLEATATTLTSSLNPSNVGQNVTFTATVSISGGGGVTPDGTVTFSDGATILGSPTINTSGVATFATTTLAEGLHSITATYGGDAKNQIQGSTSATLNQDVQANSAVVVTSSVNPSNYGVPVTFTATVTPAGAIAATGVVNFLDGGAQIGTSTLVGATNQATFNTSTLVVGAHTITVAYQGDSNNSTATSAPLTQTVNKTQTSTVVQAAPSPGIAGAPVAITATVNVISGSATTTGNVTFTNGATTLGTATLGAGGAATINPVLAPGNYSIVATYAGDVNDNTSVSTPLALTVKLATTSTVVTSTPNPALVLATVTFTAKVTGNGGIPTGSVNFIADGTTMGAANVDATGTATFTYSALAAGSHTITASYAGDVNDSPSTSPAISQVEGAIPTATSLGASSTGGLSPQTILVSAVVGTSGPTPTGTVTFNNGTTVIGSATLDGSGVATLVPNLGVGNFSIVANYGGDTLHSPSSSQPVSIAGEAAGFNIAATPSSISMSSTQNAQVTVTLTSNSGFTDTIGFGCGSLPSGVTCHFASISTPLAANLTATDVLTIDANSPLTGGSTVTMNSHSGPRGVYIAGFFLPLSLFFGWIFWRFRKRHGAVLSMVLLLALSGAAMLVSGCNGISTGGATPGTYVIQVVGTGANSDIIHYQNVTLTITQ